MGLVRPDDQREFSPPQLEQLIEDLNQLLPEQALLFDQESLKPYSCDGLSMYQRLPLAVAIPYTIEQAQAVVRYCHQQQIPIVPRGAGTGLSGGALPHHQGILLSMARLREISEIDPLARTCRVQCGVTNLAISEAVKPLGLYYAPDPSSQVACTIGGNIAENAGGVHCLKYGLTVHNVLEITVITANGDLLTVGSSALDSPGYDLLALMIGSEGLLGITVSAKVKLLPIPDHTQVILAAFHDVSAAGQAVADTISAGIIPAGMEMIDQLTITAVNQFLPTGYPDDASAILLCEVDGSAAEVEADTLKISEIMTYAGAYTVQAARDEQQRKAFWAGRKAAFPAIGRLSPDYYCMDGTIPRKALPEVLTQMQRLSRQYDLQVANVFHAGDGNLHPLIMFDANQPGELDRAEQLGHAILTLCLEMGGTVTGEHGVGMEKLNNMCNQFDHTELSQYHAIKQAFDPAGILNPGKAVPSLHRCAELGGMHVHDGQLPHPELERF